MNHEDVFSDTWRNKEDDRLDYVENDALCMAFSYARYKNFMQELTSFGMKDYLTLPGLGWKYFISLREEEDMPIHTHNDKYMRWFIRQSIKRGRVCAD